MKPLIAIILIFAATAAFAATDAAPAAVTVPWGAWLAQIVQLLAPAIGVIAISLAHKFITGPLALFISDSTITNAVNTVIAKQNGVIAGEVLEVPVANALAQKILSYLIVQEPAVVKQFGPKLGDVILAKLSAAGVLPASGVVAPKA